MADAYIGIYAILLLLVLGFIVFFYPKLRLIYFDPTFALSIRLRVKFFEKLFSWLLVLAVIAAMKSVGVVLLSGMLIAPALTAKRLTKHLSSMLVLSGVIGGILGFLGAYTSVKLSQNLHPLVFPTGPMIVLMGALLCVITLCFSHTKKRKVNKMWRIGAFLQFLDKMEGDTYLQNIVTYSQKGFFSIWRAAFFAEKKGWVKKIRGEYLLTESGKEVMKSIWGVK
jgi:manganese/zinc/iron transport system permease protein